MIRIDRRRMLAAGAGLLAAPALAQPAWPNRAVRIVVPLAAGGQPDAVARPLADKLSQRWGQQVVVDNRPGAGTNVGTVAVSRAEPDGYTLLLSSFATAVNTFLYRPSPFDPIADLAPISHLVNTPNFLIVAGATPFRTLADLVGHARANPGKVTYGSAGAGSSLHLIAELFRVGAGVDLNHIPYRGSAPAINDMLAGRLDMMFNSVGTSLQHMASGGLRAVAISSANRSAAAPDVPTLSELGVRGFPANSWFGLSAPPRTPPDLIARIAADAQWALREPDLARRMAETFNDVVASGPEGLTAHLRAEMARWEPVIRENRIVAEG